MIKTTTTTPTDAQPPLSLRAECLTGEVVGLGLGVVPEPPAEGVEPEPRGIPLELVTGDLVVRGVDRELFCDVSSVCSVSTVGAAYAGLSAKQTGHLVRLSSSGTKV